MVGLCDCMGFSLVVESGGYSSCGVRAFPWGGFSYCRACALGHEASIGAACGLSSCGTWAELLRGMCHPPRPGIEPVSPALAGGFFTTEPQGKSSIFIQSNTCLLSCSNIKLNTVIMPRDRKIHYCLCFEMCKEGQVRKPRSLDSKLPGHVPHQGLYKSERSVCSSLLTLSPLHWANLVYPAPGNPVTCSYQILAS